MASDLSTVAFIYLKKYADGAPSDIAMREHALFSRIAKQGGFTGANFNYAIKYVNPQGVSGSFSKAKTNVNNSKGKQLLANRKKKYGYITLDGEAMASCEDRGAFLDLVTMETDGVLEEMGDSLAFDLYRDGTGNRGRRASISVNTITLSDPDTARNFKEGMVLVADNDADGSSLRTGSTFVTAVDEDNGTITVDDATDITAFADNDYLFRDGDPGTCMEGLATCTPLTAPTAGDSFRGIDRSSDPRRLAGSRLNDTANTIEENIGRVAIKISQIRKRAPEAYINPIPFWQVARRLNAKVEYTGGGGDATYGFETIYVASPAGTVKLIADADCPTNRFYLCNPAAHYIKHLRELPHIIKDDGRASLRSVDADSIEARARSWSNYIQKDTGAFGVGAI